jgi:hypothetical protein
VRPGRTHGNRCSGEAGHPFTADAGGRLTGRPGAYRQRLEPADPWAVMEWNEAGGPGEPGLHLDDPVPHALEPLEHQWIVPGQHEILR